MDSRTTHSERDAEFDRKNWAEVERSIAACRSGDSPQCTPYEEWPASAKAARNALRTRLQLPTPARAVPRPGTDVPPIAPVPDLADLTGMPDGGGYRREEANAAARRAGRTQATGEGMRRWHASVHDAVMSNLAAAETLAPAEDRAWHAARLDAYAAAYGLRGWHRYADRAGKHMVQCNRIRTHLEGDRGRYYTVRLGPRGAGMDPGPRSHAVIDRDSQRTVYAAVSQGIAWQWIEAHECGAAVLHTTL
ncbi:hypothetical protein HUT19_41195 [Streptomyces sp. NA02950]|uniref:hypothetical protein n=1 Tax=Streptomyces sp. NA02950 TaxID=2742137 RepID=UPI0015900EDE|nr:hypothetical protein [Streptomyces sp. NA02950]QKV90369.1 hypothetical protein HUT19_00025 [Streptomyces sp. NA02950]QKV97298.1 hypothetical protein HUT19_41195 [Streptomyces sp. NA02950]